MIQETAVILGGKHVDERGVMSFVNDFDMTQVKRFYKIKHVNTITVRGWRAHKIEQRWFHVIEGVFLISVVEIDNWITPKNDVVQTSYQLAADDVSVLYVPKGYATSIRALTPIAEMIVFGDYAIEHAKLDDHLFSPDYFINLNETNNET